MKSYKEYREEIIRALSTKIREHRSIPPGSWKGVTSESYRHILPLSTKNTREARISAIRDYPGIEIEDSFIPRKRKGEKEPLHLYAHHVNSSQLLCYNTFRRMLTDDHNPTFNFIKLLNECGIKISQQAYCLFEYNDGMRWDRYNKSEETSFDFYINDVGHEYFFEIKFTEDGFRKADDTEYHKQKIDDLYLCPLKELTKRNDITHQDCLNNYQLVRNIIRGISDSKTIVFITDANNVSTENDLNQFMDEFLRNSNVRIVKITWQSICKHWPNGLQKPFQFCCFEDSSSL